ncbi:MarR family transcriptional regulator [Nocardia sp. ET3-3]|uniref:MarR family transcriptional regulator n=1 Tax=Nocardia terrae TaxID=2675851 RepID=A0A7K1UQK1_9NOCA|nr:MarR family transcriptional regulator [Nocardia terrae]MVU76604.1 MarR family transcriptional regulator [Nocardia terrae]
MSTARDDLIAQVMAAGRAMSTAAVMHHAAVAEHLGLSAVEEKTLELLQRTGPLTAGELARRSGLAPNTTTYLLDRLAQKGFVRRAKHPDDGRKVLVEVNEHHMVGGARFFVEFARQTEQLLAGYTDEQLRTILDFSLRITEINHEATARLAAD